MNIRATILLALATAACGPSAHAPCSLPASTAPLPIPLREASGAAFTDDGTLWLLADSGEPLLHVISDDNRIVRQVRISNARVQDWESLDSGPCPAGECLFIGEIGDNRHRRQQRAVLRIAVPSPRDSVAHGERFPFRYPDGPSDAEALAVLPDGSFLIITKGRNRAAGVYRYRAPLQPDSIVTLDHVQDLTAGIVQVPRQPTGAATPDANTVLVRSYSAFQQYRWQSDSLHVVGTPIDLTPLAEPQGEGMAATPGGLVVLVGEAEAGGTVGRVICRLAE